MEIRRIRRVLNAGSGPAGSKSLHPAFDQRQVALTIAVRPFRRIDDDHRKPLARYGPMESALREPLAPAELHHQLGHDHKFEWKARSQVSQIGRTPRVNALVFALDQIGPRARPYVRVILYAPTTID